jgi:hypothetical protein
MGILGPGTGGSVEKPTRLDVSLEHKAETARFII